MQYWRDESREYGYPYNLICELTKREDADDKLYHQFLEAMADDKKRISMELAFQYKMTFDIPEKFQRGTEILVSRYRDGVTFSSIAKEQKVSDTAVGQYARSAYYHLRKSASQIIGGMDALIHEYRDKVSEQQKKMDDVPNLVAEGFRRGYYSAARSCGVAMNREQYESRAIGLDELYSEGELSVRSYNALIRGGYKTLGDVAGESGTNIMNLRNMGVRSFDEVESVLREHGLDFASNGKGLEIPKIDAKGLYRIIRCSNPADVPFYLIPAERATHEVVQAYENRNKVLKPSITLGELAGHTSEEMVNLFCKNGENRIRAERAVSEIAGILNENGLSFYTLPDRPRVIGEKELER